MLSSCLRHKNMYHFTRSCFEPSRVTPTLDGTNKSVSPGSLNLAYSPLVVYMNLGLETVFPPFSQCSLLEKKPTIL